NSLRYFWHRRDPAQAARDLEAIVDHYGRAWDAEEVILVGHSLGADVLPFLVNRVDPDVRDRVRLVALLGPSLSVDFKFHLSYWLRGERVRYPMSVRKELLKLEVPCILCVQGSREKNSLCRAPGTDGDLMSVATVRGGHHYRRHAAAIARLILAQIPPGMIPPDETPPDPMERPGSGGSPTRPSAPAPTHID
ncbi:MAG TPA: AcvB/VirJ family lysyl-phosphatidylglycerol hydrolase, partial [Candidatus Polarisedimenticolia bacterium]|nr:AcvB/VirJ family lysyl-phosphatidylglycerol hydrolase [Candidatus Polarisedimenticolia bacterium]